MVGGFFLLCAIATCLLIYQGIALSKVKEAKKEKTERDKKLDSIIGITATLFTAIYLLVSFLTMAWHITWILWILFAVVEEIIRLIYNMIGEKNGK